MGVKGCLGKQFQNDLHESVFFREVSGMANRNEIPLQELDADFVSPRLLALMVKVYIDTINLLKTNNYHLCTEALPWMHEVAKAFDSAAAKLAALAATAKQAVVAAFAAKQATLAAKQAALAAKQAAVVAKQAALAAKQAALAAKQAAFAAEQDALAAEQDALAAEQAAFAAEQDALAAKQAAFAAKQDALAATQDALAAKQAAFAAKQDALAATQAAAFSACFAANANGAELAILSDKCAGMRASRYVSGVV
jgi:hypothetical protein